MGQVLCYISYEQDSNKVWVKHGIAPQAREGRLEMDEIDAQGRQLLIDRPLLTRGRLSVYRESEGADQWFPRLNVT